MSQPRLGSACVTISFSDADGFKVVHKDGTVLRQVDASLLERADWDILWSAIAKIEETSLHRWMDQNPGKSAEDCAKLSVAV